MGITPRGEAHAGAGKEAAIAGPEASFWFRKPSAMTGLRCWHGNSRIGRPAKDFSLYW
jgi:hypothetical protein